MTGTDGRIAGFMTSCKETIFFSYSVMVLLLVGCVLDVRGTQLAVFV